MYVLGPAKAVLLMISMSPKYVVHCLYPNNLSLDYFNAGSMVKVNVISQSQRHLERQRQQ